MQSVCKACESTNTATGALSARGARLTDLRRDVLAALHHADQPLGAYALFEHLKQQNKVSAPPAVYRVLDFLVEQGLVHKLESLSAYAACRHAPEHHDAVFLICRRCGDVSERAWPALRPVLERDCPEFRTEHLMVEAQGLCSLCQRQASA